jgi:hypothetical protein
MRRVFVDMQDELKRRVGAIKIIEQKFDVAGRLDLVIDGQKVWLFIRKCK